MLNWQRKLKFNKKPVLPMFMQDEIAECGHVCIAMILHFWGHKLSLSALRRMHATSVRGMTLLRINQIFHQLGFKARALRISWDELSQVKLPAILHWDNNHFVVLKKVQRQTLIIHDPASGICKHSKENSKALFSGIALEIEQSEHVYVSDKTSPLTLTKLLKTVLGMPKLVILLLLLSSMIELMQIINPMLMQYMTDSVLGSHLLSQMYMLGLGCILFALFQGVIEFLRSHLVLYTSMQITESFATEVFQHLLKLPLQFFAHRHYGDIQAKFQVIDQLKTQLSTDFWTTCLDVVMILFTVILMLLYSPVLASFVLGVLSIYGVSVFLNLRTYKLNVHTSLVLHTKTAVTFYETLRGILPIKTFIKESLWLQVWRNHYIDALNHDIQISKLHIYFRVFNQILFHAEHVLLLCAGAGLVMAQRLSIGMLLAFLAYRMLLVNKATAFIQYLFTYQAVSLQLQRLQDLLEEEPEPMLVSQQPMTITGAIEIQNISFAYPGSTLMILKDLNFKVQAGEKIAIIGPSGCGKTTLLKILMGLEFPSSGKVLLDDVPLTIFGLSHFRQLYASVMQEDELFSGSILDNITFFADNIDRDWVHEVAKSTYIHDTIMTLPMGYETLIGQSQTSLSGGQKQRILLARALYKKPQFLFLDEATSHLDVALETAINHSLQNFKMTQIIVAHRPETIANADQVICLV